MDPNQSRTCTASTISAPHWNRHSKMPILRTNSIKPAKAGTTNSQHFCSHSYHVGDYIWLDKRYFTDPVYKLKTSKKLSTRPFHPFKILELIGKNAVRVPFPDTIRAHNIVHVEHTKPHHLQPHDICVPRPQPAELHVDVNSHQGTKFSQSLSHRKPGCGCQFLALPAHALTKLNGSRLLMF